MFKVVIDATPIRPRPSGIGVYVYNLIQALINLQDRANYQLGTYYQPSLKKWLIGDWSTPKFIDLDRYCPHHLLPLPVTVSQLISRAYLPILGYLDKCLDEPHIVHGTDHVVYPCQRSRKIMTIHDLAFLKYPQYSSLVVRKTYLQRIKHCLQWTDLILTFSQNSKEDIVYFLNVKPEKVYITSQASRYSSKLIDSAQKHTFKTELHNKFNLNKPYLLFVSTIEPRKNLINLVNAFNYLKTKYKIEHELVIIGQKGWNYRDTFTAIANSPWQNLIHHLGYLSDREVALFYSQADAFIYPSYYEGFGLPILEAMSLGAPVITSSTSSLPEVAGDAALLVNPEDPLELANAILQIISDRQLRQQLITKGHQQARSFSWQRTATETLNAYQSLLG